MRLVSSVLDVLVQPMRWSLSMEVGSKLPFLDAYFPNDHELVAMLVGPISGKSFLGLVHHIRESVSLAKKSRHLTFRETTQTRLIGHKSTWAKVMAFPEWFIFASVLLFFSKKGCQSLFWETCMEIEQTNDEEHYRAAAAKYLAYSISPMSEAHSDILVKYLIQISESWTLRRLNSSTQQGIFGGSKNFRKSKLRDIKKTNTINNNDGQVLRALLEEFHDCHTKYWSEMSDSYITKGVKAQSTRTPKQHQLFRKIPLGILIGYSNLDQEGCESLLHYATTGEILQSAGTVQIKHDVQKSNRTEEALEGVHVVLDLCGTVEDMSCSMFETEEKRLDFVRQLKIKMAGFMVKCTRKLLEVNIDEDCCKMTTLMDLQRRLEDWIDQGAELIESFKPIKHVLEALKSKIHSP